MLNNIRNLILETINLYGNNNLNQGIIDEGFQKLKQVKELLSVDNNEPTETFDEEEIPFIQINYYSPKIEDTQDVVIPFYATDFYQKEYLQDDYSEEFKLRYELDGKVSYKNIKAGDNEANFGKVEKGLHWYSLQLEDKYGRLSRRICNEIWVINKEEYEIKEEETYIVTDSDLAQYNINKENSEVVEDMVNNRMGLTNLFHNLQEQGYRKCVLPNGIYRVNRALRRGVGETTPIDIPTRFTVDMNGSTFKLHPYNDREYGNIGQVENLIVRMTDTFDSHVINGTFEGDYAERRVNGWATGYNGEASNCFTSGGGNFNSLDNVTITQITGYNCCVGQNGSYGWGKLGAWEDNVVVINGVDTFKEGYTTSKLGTMDDAMLANHYIVASVWLGYGGLKSSRWNIDFHFYDENKNFIETIRTYQFTRCRIPENAKYFRVTFFNKGSNMSGLSIYHMKSERNFVFNNCHWVDNRTCSASSQFQHLTFLNCDFTRSGQSITPCEIDLEDGWEQMQDFFLEGCEIKENVGTADFIACAGINHHVENCKNFNYIARYNIRGITVRNNENCGLDLTVGYKTGNTVRCYNNTMPSFHYNDTGEYFEKEKMTYIIKNNILDKTSGAENIGIVKDCICNSINGSGVNVVDSILYKPKSNDYIDGDIYAKNCIFKGIEGQNEMKFSFNKLNTKRVYEDCIFEPPTWFTSHNYFNSGIWNNCTFKDTLLISFYSTESIKTLCMGAIQFNYCIFEKDLTIDSWCSQVQFNGCQFLGKIIYKNNAKSLVEFNDEMPTVSNYVKIDNAKEYMGINDTNKLTATVLPYTSTNLKVVWESSDTSIVEIDNEGNLLPKKAGICSVIAKNAEGTVKDEVEINFVDVDYAVNKYIDYAGNYRDFTNYHTDNRFKEVNKTDITLTKPESMATNIPFIYINQYNENKEFISQIIKSCSTDSRVPVTLNSKTKYIRVTFKCNNIIDYVKLFATYRIE